MYTNQSICGKFCLDGVEGSFTPQGNRSGTPSGQTPIRDSLGINMDIGPSDGASSFRSTSTYSQQREEMRAQLKAGLSSLPTPKNDYEIVIPEVSFIASSQLIYACIYTHIGFLKLHCCMYVQNGIYIAIILPLWDVLKLYVKIFYYI